MALERLAGEGWLTLIGGGEFSFGETLAADRAWLEATPAGDVGFLPTASGSADYGQLFSSYLQESFGRQAQVVPVYRERDARRQKNVQRLESCVALYLGGGVADDLVEALSGSPALGAVAGKLSGGGMVVAIAAAAQACGRVVRSMRGGSVLPGFAWLREGVVEPNFDPGHDRRLRWLLRQEGVTWGLGLPSSSALILGPRGQIQRVGTSFLLEDDEGDLQIVR